MSCNNAILCALVSSDRLISVFDYYCLLVWLSEFCFTSAEGGYVFTSVCLLVRLSVCLSVG